MPERNRPSLTDARATHRVALRLAALAFLAAGALAAAAASTQQAPSAVSTTTIASDIDWP